MEKKVEKKERKKTNNTVSKSVLRLINVYFWQFISYSLLVLIVGLFLMFKPAMATRTAEIITAITLIVIGLGAAFDYTFKSKIKIFDFSLVFGSIAVILGALIITNPFALTNFLAVAFGVFLVINGLVKLNFALGFRSIKEGSWMLVLTMSIISMLFGIIVIINPFANLYFTQMIGVFMILYAVIEATYTILIKQRSKDFLKLLK